MVLSPAFSIKCVYKLVNFPFTINGLTKAFSGLGAGKQARAARIEAQKMRRELDYLERTRQEVINPYEDVKDLSSMVTNPFANLQVATKASEIQGQEADISLASTLDTLRATGGAGSATALAQAALRSKQGISASIEAQEAQNEKLRAQGEETSFSSFFNYQSSDSKFSDQGQGLAAVILLKDYYVPSHTLFISMYYKIINWMG